MICSKCHHEARPDAKFCDNCGAPIEPPAKPAETELTCLVCGEKIEPGMNFCRKCGMPSVASQTDMTVVLPKKNVLKQDGSGEPQQGEAYPPLTSPDEATRVIPAAVRAGSGLGGSVEDRTRVIEAQPKVAVPVAKPDIPAPPRPVVPMAVSASSEETIMVLDPPPAKPAKSVDTPQTAGSRAKGSSGKTHKSSKLTAELERQKKRTDGKHGQGGSNNTLVIGGIAAVVVVVLVAVAAAWWFRPHKARKPVEEVPAASAPAAAPSQPVVPVSSLAPVAVPAQVQQSAVMPEASASQPTEPPTSDLKTEKRPALIVAPSVSGASTETPHEADKSEKAEKSEKSEKSDGGKSASSSRSSRRQTKSAPKSNQEDDYLRQIHRQLDSQR